MMEVCMTFFTFSHNTARPVRHPLTYSHGSPSYVFLSDLFSLKLTKWFVSWHSTSSFQLKMILHHFVGPLQKVWGTYKVQDFSSQSYDKNLNAIHLSLKDDIYFIGLFSANGFLQIQGCFKAHSSCSVQMCLLWYRV